ncbi:MAG: CocE/NonD family hydrolase [Bacillota bacterium]|nr:CocE/NonD family hydrolase [Bacillota bacterium]
MTANGPYAVRVERNVPVPLADGTRLATDVYFPEGGGGTAGDAAGAGTWPVILQRTPYDKCGVLKAEGHFFASHGYVVALQDVRGRFASEGVFEPFLHEAEDGVDTVRWLIGQPWCDGRIGTTGTSYLACTQAALAALDPPGLVVQWVSQGFSNYHTTRSRRGGAYEHHRTEWLLRMAADSKEAQADPVLQEALERAHHRPADWIGLWPVRPGMSPLALVPSYERALLDFMTRGDYDEWWLNPALSLEPYYDRYADVPAHFLGSWYDPYARAVTDNYVALAARKRGPVRLIMGPWVHGVAALGWTHAGDVDFGPDAAIEYDRLRLAWFDRWLKGREDAWRDQVQEQVAAPVRIFVMGGGTGRRNADGRLDHGGRWRDEQAWPLAGAVETRLYMHASGELSADPPAPADLGEPGAQPDPAAATSYTFDSRDPQPSAYDPREPEALFPRGGFDLRARPTSGETGPGVPLGNRHDVLVFATEPLAREVEVTGSAVVELFASSTGLDTDFTARLVDWCPPNEDYPEGYALELCQTIQRARYRDSREQATLLEPGTIYRFRLTLPPTSNLFARGHRIRVDISSSDFPRFDVNPNTGEPLGRHRRMAVVTNSVYHDAEHPSAVVLPVVTSDA